MLNKAVLIKARIAAKMSQQAVAKALQTKQPAVARLESEALKNVTILTLKRYAQAVGCRLQIRLIRNRNRKAHTMSIKSIH